MKEEKEIPKTLLLKDLFKDYYTTNENINTHQRVGIDHL